MLQEIKGALSRLPFYMWSVYTSGMSEPPDSSSAVRPSRWAAVVKQGPVIGAIYFLYSCDLDFYLLQNFLFVGIKNHSLKTFLTKHCNALTLAGKKKAATTTERMCD